MKNTVFHDATKLSLPVPEGTVSGDPVKVGALIGVAATDRGAGGNPDAHASVWRHGAYSLPVTGAITAVGTPVFVAGDGTSRITTLTATESGNTLFGYALDTKGSGAGVIRVALAQV